MSNDKKNEPCCPPFDITPWEMKTHVWEDRLFIKGSIPLLFHMPWPPMIASLMGKMWKKAQDGDAAPDMKDFLILSHDPSPWKGDFYMSVTREVPGVENVKLSGTYMTRVFDGPYNAVPQWIREMDAYVAGQGRKVRDYYFYFTTCPKCARIYGHNYSVAFAQVE